VSGWEKEREGGTQAGRLREASKAAASLGVRPWLGVGWLAGDCGVAVAEAACISRTRPLTRPLPAPLPPAAAGRLCGACKS
jgi:hypothetical protein